MNKSEKVRKLIIAAKEKKLSKDQLTMKVMKVTGFGTSLANLYIKNNRERALKEYAKATRLARRDGAAKPAKTAKKVAAPVIEQPAPVVEQVAAPVVEQVVVPVVAAPVVEQVAA